MNSIDKNELKTQLEKFNISNLSKDYIFLLGLKKSGVLDGKFSMLSFNTKDSKNISVGECGSVGCLIGWITTNNKLNFDNFVTRYKQINKKDSTTPYYQWSCNRYNLKDTNIIIWEYLFSALWEYTKTSQLNIGKLNGSDEVLTFQLKKLKLFISEHKKLMNNEPSILIEQILLIKKLVIPRKSYTHDNVKLFLGSLIKQIDDVIL